MLGAVAAIAGQYQVDRYLIALLPGLTVRLVSRPNPSVRPAPSPRPNPERRTRRGTTGRVVAFGLAGAATAVLATLSVRLTVHTDQRDHAVWHAAQRVAAAGVPADTINAGLDWDGTHATVPVDRLHHREHAYLGQAWTGMFPSSTDCYIVSVSPLGHFYLTLVEHEAQGYRTWTYRNSRC